MSDPADKNQDDDTPELLVKLRERKERHQQRNVVHRYAIVAFGVLVILVGIVLSGPGVPGPGFLVILIGISFLALEFDWAERLLERAIIFGDDLADRAEQTSKGQRIVFGIVTAIVVIGFIALASFYDIPLIPVL